MRLEATKDLGNGNSYLAQSSRAKSALAFDAHGFADGAEDTDTGGDEVFGLRDCVAQSMDWGMTTSVFLFLNEGNGAGERSAQERFPRRWERRRNNGRNRA